MIGDLLLLLCLFAQHLQLWLLVTKPVGDLQSVLLTAMGVVCRGIQFKHNKTMDELGWVQHQCLAVTVW
jgi:hypothetical protein